MTHNVYRNGRVHVMRSRCRTCIFRPDNPMRLQPGRVEQMIADADADESTIVCHSTLDTDENAACRGYFDRRSSVTLRLAAAAGVIEFV